jgi:hypothetical protein
MVTAETRVRTCFRVAQGRGQLISLPSFVGRSPSGPQSVTNLRAEKTRFSMNKNSSETGFFRFRLQEENHDNWKSTIRRRIVVQC